MSLQLRMPYGPAGNVLRRGCIYNMAVSGSHVQGRVTGPLTPLLPILFGVGRCCLAFPGSYFFLPPFCGDASQWHIRLDTLRQPLRVRFNSSRLLRHLTLKTLVSHSCCASPASSSFGRYASSNRGNMDGVTRSKPASSDAVSDELYHPGVESYR